MFSNKVDGKKLNITINNKVNDEKKVSEVKLQIDEENYPVQVFNKSEIADLSFAATTSYQYSTQYGIGQFGNTEKTKVMTTIDIKLIEKKSSWNNLFKSALFNEERSDFKFIVENERIPVNKFLLSIRSPVFDRMFNSNYKESTINEHELGFEISKEAFKELIRYMYTEQIHEFDIHVFELLHASDYFQITELKTSCEAKLFEIIKEENAHKILKASCLFHGDENLKKHAFSFIKRRFSKFNLSLPDSFIDNIEELDKATKLFDDLMCTLNQTINIDKAKSVSI
ncbi:speckle-type POZ protein-like A [Chironomus tepperi]|uniref:speckle-type POZ protein-like A n=1 Tax=Chironomus tepperi TaxID=113505 RepID=UPI00391F0329